MLAREFSRPIRLSFLVASLTGLYLPTVVPAADEPQSRSSAIAASPDSVPEAPDPKHEQQTLLRAFTENNKRLGAVELSLRFVHENHTVTEAKTIESRLENGGIARWSVAPRTERRAKAIFSGNVFRYDYLEDDETVTRTYAFNGKHWTEFDPTRFGPDRGLANIRRADQMPGMLPLDPREAVVSEFHDPMAKVLGRISLEGVDDELPNARRLRRESKSRWGARLLLEFDHDRALLPVACNLYRADGSLLSRTEAEYRKLPERDAWVLEKAVRKYYADGEPGDAFSTHTTYVDEVRLLSDAEVGRAVVPDIPESTRVVDMTKLAAR